MPRVVHKQHGPISLLCGHLCTTSSRLRRRERDARLCAAACRRLARECRGTELAAVGAALADQTSSSTLQGYAVIVPSNSSYFIAPDITGAAFLLRSVLLHCCWPGAGFGTPHSPSCFPLVAVGMDHPADRDSSPLPPQGNADLHHPATPSRQHWHRHPHAHCHGHIWAGPFWGAGESPFPLVECAPALAPKLPVGIACNGKYSSIIHTTFAHPYWIIPE